MSIQPTPNNLNRKHILYIVTQSDCGGAQRYVFDLATNLDKTKYQISVATGPDGGGALLKYLQRQQITTYQLKYLRRKICPFFDLLGLIEIIKLLKKIKPDIIHLNSSKAGAIGSLAGKIIGQRVVASLFPSRGGARGGSPTPRRRSDNTPPSPLLEGTLRTPTHSIQPNKTSNDRINIVYTVHGFVFLEPMSWLKKQFYIWIEKLSAKWKNKLITVSDADRQAGIKQKIAPTNKFVTIHNGINLNKIKFLSKQDTIKKIIPCLIGPLRRSFSEASRQANSRFMIHDSKIIGCLANYYPTKGLIYLIEAAREIIKTHPQTIFVLLGEGTERPILETKIKKYNLSNNFILGAQAKGWQYLKAFDIFILPSVKEGCPYAILEAMSAGCPIVASRVGGIPELITDQQTGLLVEPKNPPELADKINYLLDNLEVAQRLGNNARARIEKEFSLNKMVKETENIYRN